MRKPSAHTYQFAYLDEVATQSLAATLDGGIVKGSKESKTTSIEAGYSSRTGDSSLSIGSMMRSAVTRGLEISRQEVAESHFARLKKRLNQERILMLSVPEPINSPISWTLRTRGWIKDFFTVKKGLVRREHKRRTLLPVRFLQRGTALELSVAMNEPALYNLASAVGSFAEAAQNLRELDPHAQLHSEQTIRSVENMFHWLRGGMVPMRGHVTSHVKATLGDQTLIIPRHSKNRLFKQQDEVEIEEIAVAGYCTLNGFWQEPSRTFVEGSEFRCLVRIEDPAMDKKWDELDHLAVFDSLGVDVRSGARAALDAIKRQAQGDEKDFQGVTFGLILETYAEAVAAACESDLDEQSLASVLDQRWAILSPELIPVAIRRRLQKEVEVAYKIPEDVNLDAIRVSSFGKHGRHVDGRPIATQEIGNTSKEEHALRVQFIGIYW